MVIDMSNCWHYGVRHHPWSAANGGTDYGYVDETSRRADCRRDLQTSSNVSSDDSLDGHIFIQPILPSLSSKTRIIHLAEPVSVGLVPSITDCPGNTHGAEDSEMTPVLIATIPDSNLSLILVALLRSCVMM